MRGPALAGLGSVLLMAAVAAAERPQPPPPNHQLRSSAVFEMWDRDGDGYLSAAELADPQLFKQWNRDGDAKLSKAEFFDGLSGVHPKHRESGR